MDISTASGKKRRAFATTVCVVYIGIVAVFVAVVFSKYVFSSRPAMTPQKLRYEEFCCPELTEPLAYIVNKTVDACKDAFDHVCYNWKEHGISGTLAATVSRMLDASVINVTEGKTAHVLRQIHASCMAILDGSMSGSTEDHVVGALLEVLNFTTPLRVSDVLRMIVSLSYNCDVFALIKISHRPENGSQSLIIEAGPTRVNAFVTAEDMQKSFLDALNAALAVNVSMRNIASILEKMPQPGDGELSTSGNLSLTAELVPRRLRAAFTKLLADVSPLPVKTTIYVNMFEVVRERFRFLTSPKHHPMAATFILLDAALYLHSITYPIQEEFKRTRDVKCCSSHLKRYRVLLFSHLTERVSHPEKERAAAVVVAKVKNEVSKQARRIVGSKDSDQFEAAISCLKAVFPSTIYGGLQHVPLSPENIYANIMRYNEWVLKLDIERSTDALNPVQMSTRGLFDATVIVQNGHIFLPPLVFAFLRALLEQGTFEHAAVLGANVADALWDLVFQGIAGTSRSKRRLKRVAHCAARARSPMLRYGSLSLQTAALAAMDDAWHQQLPVWASWMSSKSRVFYMLYVYLYGCLPVISGTLDAAYARRDMLIVSRTPDFRSAFKCTPLRETTCSAVLPSWS